MPRTLSAVRNACTSWRTACGSVHSSHGAWPRTDGYYLYNPFGENLCARKDQLDTSVELTVARYRREIAEAEQFFARAPAATLLLTYNGFGGRVPDSYREVAAHRDQPYELWQKE